MGSLKPGPAAILLANASLTVKWCNEALFDTIPAANLLVGGQLEDLIPIAPVSGMLAMARAAAESGISQEETLHFPGPPGNGCSVAISAHRLPDGDVLILAVVR